MESWLLSKKSQEVMVGKLQKTFDFYPWEGIHVENSYKYSVQDIEEFAKAIGFDINQELTDAKGYFMEAIWQVKKSPTTVMGVK